MFEKIWDDHVVLQEPSKQAILYIDLQLVHEVTSAQAFEGLRLTGRDVRRGVHQRLCPPSTSTHLGAQPLSTTVLRS